MMKKFIKCVCVVLIIVTVFATPSFAAENEGSRSSSYFMSSSVYLWKTSGSQFQAWFEVTGMSTMTKIGASEIKIQRSTDKENWTTVATYSMDDYSQMVKSNSVYHEGYVTYTYTTGYYYRAKVKLYAKNSSGTAYMTEYTSSLDLR